MASSSSLSLTIKLTVAVAFLVMAVTVPTAESQAQTCASKLIPCASYLNATTTPPNTCCDPIKEAVANDLQCLCNLYENPSFLSGLGINVEQALRLPRLCGISSDASACNNAQAPTGSGTKPPQGNIPAGNDVGSTPGGNGVGKVASSGVFGFLLLSVCIMLF